MPSKRSVISTLAAVLLIASCRSLPWQARVDNELNLALSFHNNQLMIPSATVEGTGGVFILGTATPQLALSTRFVDSVGQSPRRKVRVRLAEKEAISVVPYTIDLGDIADGILGMTVWRNGSMSIDYSTGLLSYSNVRSFVSADMVVYDYDQIPTITVEIDGESRQAIVDTTIPDTLILPSTRGPVHDRRTRVNLVLAGQSFPGVSARVSPGSPVRIGNRILSKFLVAIDYRSRKVGLWRDPRTSSTTIDR